MLLLRKKATIRAREQATIYVHSLLPPNGLPLLVENGDSTRTRTQNRSTFDR